MIGKSWFAATAISRELENRHYAECMSDIEYYILEWLMREEGFTEEDAMEWIDYNTIRALPYMGEDGPIVLYRFMEEYHSLIVL